MEITGFMGVKQMDQIVEWAKELQSLAQAGLFYGHDIYDEDGYPDVQVFKRLYDEATILVEQYNRDLAAWERQVHGEPQPQQAPPEKESIRKKLREMDAEAKRRNDARRQQTRPRSHDYDRGS